VYLKRRLSIHKILFAEVYSNADLNFSCVGCQKKVALVKIIQAINILLHLFVLRFKVTFANCFKEKKSLSLFIIFLHQQDCQSLPLIALLTKAV